MAIDPEFDSPQWVTFTGCSADVYSKSRDPSIHIPYFERIMDSGDSGKFGYFGAMYKETDTDIDGNFRVIIAHKGTSILPDYWEDLDIFMGKAFAQLDEGRKFAQDCVSELMKFYAKRGESQQQFMDRIEIYNTGHSLGGVISDIVATLDFKDGSYTIENPGALESYQNYTMGKKSPKYMNVDCKTLHNLPNFINTVNNQMGTITRCWVINYDFVTPTLLAECSNISTNVFMNTWYIKYGLANHHIKPIHQAMCNIPPIIGDAHVKPGLQSGFDILMIDRFQYFWKPIFNKSWESLHKDEGISRQEFIDKCWNNLCAKRRSTNSSMTYSDVVKLFGKSRKETKPCKTDPQNDPIQRITSCSSLGQSA
jgi:hypothetical protein